MAEWWIERGIGETRAALIEADAIVAARIERDDDGPRVGAVMTARLADRARRLVALDDGGEATLDAWPADRSEGARLNIAITRTALRERGRVKPPRAQLAGDDAAPCAGADLAARLAATGTVVREIAREADDVLEAAGWSEFIARARDGIWPFAGGCLWIDATPAMTLIDIDGEGAPADLAAAGVTAAVAAIVGFDIGGSIGIDVPNLPSKAARQAVAALVDDRLTSPFERTAINGFGLLQLVRPRRRPSLIEQLRFDPVASDAADLLRRAERARGAGDLTLTARAPVIDRLMARRAWIDELQRRTGRAVVLKVDDTVSGAGHAQ